METNTTNVNKSPRRTDDEWYQIIMDCRTSGLSDKAWCREHKIGTSAFYYHLKRLTLKACQFPENTRSITREHHEIVPLKIEDEPVLPAVHTEQIPETEGFDTEISDTVIRMSLHDISLEFTNQADKSTIASVVAALRLLC